jgi:hypothetical protein
MGRIDDEILAINETDYRTEYYAPIAKVKFCCLNVEATARHDDNGQA